MKKMAAGALGTFVLAAAVAAASPGDGGLAATPIGEWTGGSGSTALRGPVDLALDRSGNVYVVEQTSARVQVFTADGRFIRQIGGPRVCLFQCRPDQINGRFWLPNAIAVDSAGYAYVLDLAGGLMSTAGRVQKFAPDGAFVTAFEGVGFDYLSYPRDVEVDGAGGLYVADWGKHRVLLLAGDSGAFIREWGASEFYPWGLAVDEARGVLYVVADDAANPIVVLSLEGGLLTRLGQGYPRGAGIALDREGRLYVLGGNGVRVFSPQGDFQGQWGSTGDGPGQFRSATGIAVDEQGLVYVADFVRGDVQVFRVEFDR